MFTSSDFHFLQEEIKYKCEKKSRLLNKGTLGILRKYETYNHNIILINLSTSQAHKPTVLQD